MEKNCAKPSALFKCLQGTKALVLQYLTNVRQHDTSGPYESSPTAQKSLQGPIFRWPNSGGATSRTWSVCFFLSFFLCSFVCRHLT